MAGKRVVVYSTPACPWCARVKEYLSQKGVAYQEYDVASDRNAALEMIEKTRQMGVPVTVIDDQFVVGFDQGELDRLLA